MSEVALSELDVLLERSDFNPIIRQYVKQPRTGIWVRGRKFSECAIEYRFEVDGKAMSPTCLRNALNSLIHKGYVHRIRWRQVTDLNGTEIRLDRLTRDDPRDYYNDDKEFWEYVPAPDLTQQITAQAKKEKSQFAS